MAAAAMMIAHVRMMMTMIIRGDGKGTGPRNDMLLQSSRRCLLCAVSKQRVLAAAMPGYDAAHLRVIHTMHLIAAALWAAGYW